MELCGHVALRVRTLAADRRAFACCAVLLAAAFGLDVATTTLLIAGGGGEVNPLMAPWVGDPLVHLIIKLAAGVYILGAAAIGNRFVPPAGTAVLACISALYVGIAVCNAAALFGLPVAWPEPILLPLSVLP
jgi:hypothetical protein